VCVKYTNIDIRIYHWKDADPKIFIYHRAAEQLNFPVFAAFVCAVVSGAWTSLTSTVTDASYALREASSILLLVTVVLAFPICFFSLSVSKYDEERRDPLLLQVVIVLPIFLNRSVYSVVQSFFSNRQSPFHNTWAYFSLLMLMDYISFVILTLVGLSVQRSPTTPMKRASLSPSSSLVPNDQPPEAVQQVEQPVCSRWQRRNDRKYPGAIHLFFDFLLEYSTLNLSYFSFSGFLDLIGIYI
jgi:hypothetical protein